MSISSALSLSSGFSLHGKKGLILGIANDQSIAWGCAKAMHTQGAELAITYLNDKAKPHVAPLAQQLNAPLFLPCNVSDPGALESVFAAITDQWGTLDFLLHSIAYAPLEDLHGRVTDCTREGFLNAMDISCHSFIRMAKLAEPLMPNGGSLLTVSYYGSEKVVSNYGMMGPVKAALEATTRYLAAELGEKAIRVNTLSPGPIATRAASGIGHFNDLLASAQQKSPLKRLATIEDVGHFAAYLCTDAAHTITAGLHYIDAGYGMID